MAAWAAVGKLEKHLLSSCHTELQSRFTGRLIRQVLTLPPTLPSTSVQMSLPLCMQAASNLSTHSKILFIGPIICQYSHKYMVKIPLQS